MGILSGWNPFTSSNQAAYNLAPSRSIEQLGSQIGKLTVYLIINNLLLPAPLCAGQEASNRKQATN